MAAPYRSTRSTGLDPAGRPIPEMGPQPWSLENALADLRERETGQIRSGIDRALAGARQAGTSFASSIPWAIGAAQNLPGNIAEYGINRGITKTGAGALMGEYMEDAPGGALALEAMESAQQRSDRAGISRPMQFATEVGVPDPWDARKAIMLAFHGSPHRWGVNPETGRVGPDMSKMGTGEGNQAYAHGHYSAENPGVAGHYQMQHGYMQPSQIARNLLNDPDIKGDARYAAEMLRYDAHHRTGVAPPGVLIEAAELLESGADLAAHRSGSLYGLTHDVNPEDLLDWDKPLGEQSQKVQDALRQYGVTIPRPYEVIKAEHDPLLKELFDLEMAGRQRTPRGDELRLQLGILSREMNQHVNPMTGEGLYRSLGRDEAASKALADAGIPGTQFLDQGSRYRPFDEIREEFLAELPEDAGIEEVAELLDSGHFSESKAEVLRALQDDDWLGFDYPAQAISAAFSPNLGNWEHSPGLVEAINRSRGGDVTRNIVMFGDDLTYVDPTRTDPSLTEGLELGLPERWKSEPDVPVPGRPGSGALAQVEDSVIGPLGRKQ